MTDRILKGWKEIVSITPWKNHAPGVFRRLNGKWLQDNGYVLRSVIGQKVIIWTWESLLKSGIIVLMKNKAEIRAARPKRKWRPAPPIKYPPLKQTNNVKQNQNESK